MDTFEINGVAYKAKILRKRVGSNANALTSLFISMFEKEMRRPMEKLEDLGVYIVDEYRLICDKKSNLSRSDRETVIYEFNKRFEPVNSVV